MGSGPSVVLVDGGFGHRGFGPNCTLGPLLSGSFTVFRYDRRGRGDSGDTAPLVAQREIEDLDAVIQRAGGSAFVYGISSGAAIALEAARQGLDIHRLAVWEAPFIVDGSRPLPPDDLAVEVEKLVSAGRWGAAVRLFLRRGVGVPQPFVELQRGTPLPLDRWASVTQPVLVMAGGRSPAWLGTAMRSLADALADSRYLVLDRHMHVVDGDAVAPPLGEFFRDSVA
ncbi:alpha/beta fold hydrolase [Pseudonocardia saturnea]